MKIGIKWWNKTPGILLLFFVGFCILQSQKLRINLFDQIVQFITQVERVSKVEIKLKKISEFYDI